MADETTSSSSEVARPARRWRPWLIGLALLLLIQSITITLPIQGRVVDETTGEPVPHAAVAALWRLEAWTPVHVTPGGTVRIAQAVTNEDGAFEFSIALMAHLPLLPFSPLTRTDDEMPALIVVADGYQPKSAKHDGRRSGFLSLRTSSLQGESLRLTPLPADGQQRTEYQGNLGWVRTAIDLAAGSCASRWYCRSDSLAEVRGALERGRTQAQSDQTKMLREEPR